MAIQTLSTLLTLVAAAEIGIDDSGELNKVHMPNRRLADMKIRSARTASPALKQSLCQTIPAESGGRGLNAENAQKFLSPAPANMRTGRYS